MVYTYCRISALENYRTRSDEEVSDYMFGAYILEILTAGMYHDSRITFREYVQNSCDAIDKAVAIGVLSSKTEGIICIEINPSTRNITIEDNGTGICAENFAQVMGSIAASEKRQSMNKGFRGIGKLCGLAYCTKAVFTAKFKGESVVSKLQCDAKTMRQMLGEDAKNKYKAAEILHMVNEFSTEATDNIDGHYFRVELVGINEENTNLLDFERVSEYLSFVAPIPYDTSFMPYSARIHEHAEKLGLKIDEYNIFLNGDQLFKRYTRSFVNRKGKGSDEIFDLSFKDFRNANNELVAWMWFGVSQFKGAIKAQCPMRGIRLRKENIQIGDQDALQQFFTEQRWLHFFIGEIFCISKDFIPNSRRDYFNENPARVDFETQLIIYFKALSRLCHECLEIYGAFRKIDAAEKKREVFAERVKSKSFISYQEMQSARESLQKFQEDAYKAVEHINKLRADGNCLLIKIIKHIEDNRRTESRFNQEYTLPIESLSSTQLTDREQSLISRVFEVIESALPPAEAKELIHLIQDKL